MFSTLYDINLDPTDLFFELSIPIDGTELILYSPLTTSIILYPIILIYETSVQS